MCPPNISRNHSRDSLRHKRNGTPPRMTDDFETPMETPTPMETQSAMETPSPTAVKPYATRTSNATKRVGVAKKGGGRTKKAKNVSISSETPTPTPPSTTDGGIDEDDDAGTMFAAQALFQGD